MTTAIYNNPEIKTDADRARQKFINAGLTYFDIGSKEFYKLISFLEKELENFDGDLKMRISQRLKRDKPQFNMNTDGSLKTAFIRVSAYYFEGREAISFNNNGWIGFAGWACSSNLIPFTTAFEKWIDEITKVRG